MLDIARLVVLMVAIAQAVRHRFALGVILGLVLVAGFLVVASAACVALSRGSVSGEYAFAFVYVGPTMVPFQDRAWLPSAVQAAFALVSGLPAWSALRAPSSPVATPFALLFVASAMLAVLTALVAFLLWRQVASFPEYWTNP